MSGADHSRWRKAVPYLLGVALLGLLVWGFRPVPRLVDVEPVDRGHLAVTVEAEGRTRVIDRYTISAPVPGQARRQRLEVGDAVAEGEVVAVLDALAPPVLDVRDVHQARARVAAAAEALAAAEEAVKAAAAAAKLARSEAARLERLASQKMVSQSLLEQAQTEVESAAAQLASARFSKAAAAHELEAARAELAYAGGQDPETTGVLELRSPVAGQVLRRQFESAQVVQAGEPILEIGDPSRLEVEVDVLSADAVRIRPGMRVWLERSGYDAPLEAQVQRIEPTAFTKISALGVEEQRVWVIADFVGPPERWERLGDGYRVNARFVLWEGDDVLRVPTSSLFRRGEDWAVFVAEEGRARLRRLEIGHRSARHTEVLDGLEAGVSVIVHPDREIEDGVRIQRRE